MNSNEIHVIEPRTALAILLHYLPVPDERCDLTDENLRWLVENIEALYPNGLAGQAASEVARRAQLLLDR